MFNNSGDPNTNHSNKKFIWLLDYWKFVIQAISHATYHLNNQLLVRYSSYGLTNTIQWLNSFGRIKYWTKVGNNRTIWLILSSVIQMPDCSINGQVNSRQIFCYSDHLWNNKQFLDWNNFDHLNTRLVCYLDPQCNWYKGLVGKEKDHQATWRNIFSYHCCKH